MFAFYHTCPKGPLGATRRWTTDPAGKEWERPIFKRTGPDKYSPIGVPQSNPYQLLCRTCLCLQEGFKPDAVAEWRRAVQATLDAA